jgi:hypothetical protein
MEYPKMLGRSNQIETGQSIGPGMKKHIQQHARDSFSAILINTLAGY